MSVKARMNCVQITDRGSEKEVKLTPVVTSSEDDPNHSYSKYTPSGEITLSITNPAAFEQFVVGEIYDVTFEECVAHVE